MKNSKPLREIVFDAEMTGLSVVDGHRLVEVAAVEIIDKVPTGRVFHAYINPGRKVPKKTIAIHGLTNEFLADKPYFAEIIDDLIDFIGDSPIVITCRTTKGIGTPDIEFMDSEMLDAGATLFLPTQWLNVRPWGEEMFGYKEASLNNMLKHYNIPNPDRDDKSGHGATKDAELLARLYPLLEKDYQDFIGNKSSKPSGPSAPSP